MKSASIALLLLAAAALLPADAGTGVAKRNCDRDWVCVELAESPAGVIVSGRNLSSFPVTLTVRIRGRGVLAPAERTATYTLGGGASREFLRLHPSDPVAGYHYRYWFDWTVGDLDATHDDDYLYRLPYATGKRFRILQGFGSRFSHTGLEHYAVDFDMPEGTPVHAARGGVVARLEESHDTGCWREGCGRFANYIVILHEDGTTGEYYHLRQYGVLVETGERVEGGDLIGLSGNTGHTTMPHLHFAVYLAGEWGRTRSLPVRFRHRDGIASAPRSGQRLTAD